MATIMSFCLLFWVGFSVQSISGQLSDAQQRHSLCVRGGIRRGIERQCFPGIRGSDCPRGWTVTRPNNYLMCWATRNVCCRRNEVPITTQPPPSGVNHPECGTLSVTSRITNAQNELPCLSPWQVSLRRRIPGLSASLTGSVHVAGGVLIQTRWVLTTPLSVLFAGRASFDEQFQDAMIVSLGDYNHREDNGNEVIRMVRNVYFHPDFRFDTSIDFNTILTSGDSLSWQANAFALIELDTEVPVSACVRPACLPNSNGEICADTRCKLTGWGANENEELGDILQKADITIFGREACEAIDHYSTGGSVQLPERTGCAVSTNGSFACVGDFGGPVVCEGATSSDPRTVEGLPATRLECGTDASPTIIALVREAVPWIEDIIGNAA